LAEQAGHAGLDVRGVFTFPGHSYSPDARQRVVRQEADALARAAGAFDERGLACPVRSGGSTPTAHSVDSGTMTELRPGVYVFGDAQQLELGTIGPDRIALTCMATVVSHAGGNTVLDSGSKALGADRAPWASGYGRLLDHLDARIASLSEHHAVVTWPETAPRPEIGSRVRVVPNHVCNAVNLADTLLVCREGQVVQRWPVTARGANT
jgi:D-serine deaminase-like pyridoxal phosphate-dependent protein